IKTRKLETVFAYMIAKKYTDVVLVVPNISNLRSDIELFAASNSIHFHLVVANDPFLKKEVRSVPVNTKNVNYIISGRLKLGAILKVLMIYGKLLLQKKRAAWFFPS